jgi:ferredoxin
MKNNFLFIHKEKFLEFLKKLSSIYKVVVPQGEKDYIFEEFKDDFCFNQYRPVASLRQFFLPSVEKLNEYFDNSQNNKNSFCIVGVKNCDLYSLKIQNCIFLEDEADAGYDYQYKNNLIISSDCTSFKEVCFCVLLDIKPFPQNHFDLNLSLLNGGYLIEIGSEKGKKVIEENKDLFEEINQQSLKERETQRNKIIKDLSSHLEKQGIPKKELLYQLVKEGYENEIWQEEALRCVECGCCIMNCPTCHCFLLFDIKRNDKFIRARTWDGCQYKNFARVAGGANPLKFRMCRQRNRYIKKFEFFIDRCDLYACTGCGRCIEGCPAKIDIREIFKVLSGKQK